MATAGAQRPLARRGGRDDGAGDRLPVRIVAGSRKGARIFPPKGETRPTGDRVREAAFNLIGPVDGARVLDLFAGSGALCLDALRALAAETAAARQYDLVLVDAPYRMFTSLQTPLATYLPAVLAADGL